LTNDRSVGDLEERYGVVKLLPLVADSSWYAAYHVFDLVSRKQAIAVWAKLELGGAANNGLVSCGLGFTLFRVGWWYRHSCCMVPQR
jgi:hypothetical protein